jgi:hypothetical protein
MRRSVSRDHVSSNLYLHKAANTLVTGAGWLEPSPAKLGEIENWGCTKEEANARRHKCKPRRTPNCFGESVRRFGMGMG